MTWVKITGIHTSKVHT
ncbi:Protein of unknown function [Pyronema omphalodes CBS 100304]|uniref:Uncharacterized protein n=1 Tax=Pyronema omphalodes (strain CBS 100304) TaxID=1076935 RepID=U4LND0_PYROM|nr:Protein of unknown function [Pyronema omphalodes CBS 100304]